MKAEADNTWMREKKNQFFRTFPINHFSKEKVSGEQKKREERKKIVVNRLKINYRERNLIVI